MTFNVTVPNTGQSPAFFPSQNNDNFLRLQAIINNDHNFTNSTSLAEGIHKQSTYINRTTPVGLTAGNGILYSKTDQFSTSQLFWYNGGNDVKVTPNVQVITGSQSFTGNETITIYPDPGFAFSFNGWAGVNGSTSASSVFTVFGIHYGNGTNTLTQTGGNITFSFLSMANDVQLTNNSGSTRTLIWALQVIRIPS